LDALLPELPVWVVDVDEEIEGAPLAVQLAKVVKQVSVGRSRGLATKFALQFGNDDYTYDYPAKDIYVSKSTADAALKETEKKLSEDVDAAAAAAAHPAADASEPESEMDLTDYNPHKRYEDQLMEEVAKLPAKRTRRPPQTLRPPQSKPESESEEPASASGDDDEQNDDESEIELGKRQRAQASALMVSAKRRRG
jgi:hypothetical protein